MSIIRHVPLNNIMHTVCYHVKVIHSRLESGTTVYLFFSNLL